MSIVRDLYQLQLVDSEHQQKRSQLEEVNSNLGETAELVRARDEVVESQESLNKLRSQLRVLDLDVASVSSKLKNEPGPNLQWQGSESQRTEQPPGGSCSPAAPLR